MVQTSQSLRGKNFVVAGARGLIGRAIVEAILSRGGRVLGLDRRPAVKHEERSSFYLEIECDLLEPDSLREAIERGFLELGEIHGGVNAAYPRTDQGFEDFGAFSRRGLESNLYGQIGHHLLFAESLLSSKIATTPMSIVFLGSIQGSAAPKFEHYVGTTMDSPIEYSVSKSALLGAAKWLSARFGNLGHRFNVLSPGGISDVQPERFRKRYRASTLTKGLLDPVDIAGPTVFLLSEQSLFLTGQNLIVDDGWSL
jgi:NAD(P)-dependent dehydrogenase (short-subunit alcohol dehydrogenase family)